MTTLRYTPEILVDIHERAHRSFARLMEHCRGLGADALNRPLDGFGHPTVRLQIHHAIDAERYWIGVLEGKMLVDDDDAVFPTLDSLDAMRRDVFAVAERYLRAASNAELNTPRPMTTWGGNERTLTPAHVVLRAATHLFHHQGQILAMCRLLGRPGEGFDYPLV